MKHIDERLKSLFPDDKEVGAERLIVLNDGVFAIAMTLLVLDIRIPPGTQDFHKGLAILMSRSLYYLITFAVIARYWRFHRRLMYIVKYVDTNFIRLNLLYLALIAFFPAAMNLVGEYGDNHVEAVIIYVLVLAACGFLGQGMWFYAFWKCRLTDIQIDHKTFIYIMIDHLIFPSAICLSLLLLLIPAIQPSSIFWSWLGIPFLNIMERAIYKRWQIKRTQSFQE